MPTPRKSLGVQAMRGGLAPYSRAGLTLWDAGRVGGAVGVSAVHETIVVVAQLV